MALAIELAAENVRQQTGGPFGAAVFSASGQLISMGVNRVLPLHNSTAHAEMMALMLAQKALQTHRLDANDQNCTLATSAQPCAMCFGAIPWAGIRTLLIGASKDDVESLTSFDEGPLPPYWLESLRKRGIHTTTDLLRPQACEVLSQYTRSAGQSY